MTTYAKPVSTGVLRCLVCLVATIAVSGCAWLQPAPPPEPEKEVAAVPESGPPIPEENEAVLPAGSVLIAHTAAGKIKIESGPGSLRVFTWDEARRGVAMAPRDEPFPGAQSAGIHFNGTPPVWEPHNGISKVDYEESKRNFETTDDLVIWTQIRRIYFAYNDAGLAVAWKRDGDTLRAEVWQFYIDGELPESLPGSEPDAVTLKSTAEIEKEQAAAKEES